MKKGIIFHKLRNKKSVTKPKELKNDKTAENELKSMLKYCVVNNDRKKLEEILSETISIRRKLLKIEGDDFKEFWKFYFVETDLVSNNVLLC